MGTTIEEIKKKDIDFLIKLQMELADYHNRFDKRYYKSGRGRKNN